MSIVNHVNVYIIVDFLLQMSSWAHFVGGFVLGSCGRAMLMRLRHVSGGLSMSAWKNELRDHAG